MYEVLEVFIEKMEKFSDLYGMKVACEEVECGFAVSTVTLTFQKVRNWVSEIPVMEKFQYACLSSGVYISKGLVEAMPIDELHGLWFHLC